MFLFLKGDIIYTYTACVLFPVDLKQLLMLNKFVKLCLKNKKPKKML